MKSILKYVNKLKDYKNGAVYNVILNTLATGVPVVVLQIIILPLISGVMTESSYGLLISVTSLLNLVPFSLGNSLSGIRLLNRNKYEDNKISGDFSCIKIVCLSVTFVIVLVFSIYYYRNESSYVFAHIVLTIVLAMLWFLREYYSVSFLLKLDYASILLNNLLLCCGYLLGLLIFYATGFWEFIYLLGYIVSLSHIFLKTDVWKERITRTPFFAETLRQEVIYFIASLLYRVPTYADKILLYPLLGGAFVSVYYVATLSGKVITMLVTPITNVMLSYLAKEREGRKAFRKTMLVGTTACIIGYFICLFISRPVLEFIYPQFAERAMQFVPTTTATVMIGVMISIINPFILKNQNISWQLVINIFTFVVYIAFSLGFFMMYDLMGFCIGALTANIFKLIFMLWIFLKREGKID